MSDVSDEPSFCDFNAGAPALPDVLEEFVAVEQRCPANPASAHSAGRRARGELERARERVAQALGLAAEDVVFTSGGTEAANLAVTGLGDPELPVLLGDLEHAAVWEAAQRRGVRSWRVDHSGRVVVRAPDGDVGLVAIVHAQSEVGTLQPVDAAASVAKALGVPIFVDAAQTVGRVPVRPLFEVGASVAVSPHKFGGLRGHGLLVGDQLQSRLQPLLAGGGQELGLRPGTQSVALAAANALAVERAVQEQEQRASCMRHNRESFLDGLRERGGAYRSLTPLDQSLPNTIMLCFEGVDGRHLLPALDLAGVQASHGSACSSGSPTPPRVLASMSLSDSDAQSCVRFSFGWSDEREQLAQAGHVVARVVARLRKKM